MDSTSSSSFISQQQSTSFSSSSFSASTSYQPLCFSKDVFAKENFNVDAFIADCRKRVPLESVLHDLKEYANSLDNELIELINKDYTDFVNLSSNLVGIDKVLNDLRTPLLTIQKEVEVCWDCTHVLYVHCHVIEN